MNNINSQDIFDKHSCGDTLSDEYLRFDRVENKMSSRPDLHAFILLNELVPRDRDIVSSAAHDEIYLDVTPEELNAVATEHHIIELIRCGVRLCKETDSLAMFV